MESSARSIEILEKHLDLLPVEKQSIARWLCESWRGTSAKLPRQLRHRITHLFALNLSSPDAPALLLRELTLELLATNKAAIAQRSRTGASRHVPNRPRSL